MDVGLGTRAKNIWARDSIRLVATFNSVLMHAG